MILESMSRYWWRRDRRRNARSLEELEKFPTLTSVEQLIWLQRALHSQIKYFGRREDALPEWREAACIKDPAELWRVWPTLPIVDRKLLQTHLHPQAIAQRFNLTGKLDATGGSTGEPTPFFHDTEMLRANAAVLLHARLQMGWKPGRPTIIIWGSERDIGKETNFRNRLNNALFSNFLVDGYHLTRQTVERVLSLIRHHQPVAIYGFTAMLEHVARETLAMGACPPPGSVYLAWNGGEMLFPEQSEIFQRAFGVPILNCYGGRELPAIASQHKAGNPLHITRPWNFIELVDDSGKPVGPGEPGRVICTSTICRGTPFLRYEIGDLADYDAADCDESGIRALREILGRTASVVALSNGKRIHTLYWNHLMKEFKEVRQFQIIIKNDGGLLFLLKGDGLTTDREAQLRTILEDFIGNLPVKLQWVDSIPLTRQGKLVQVVREPA